MDWRLLSEVSGYIIFCNFPLMEKHYKYTWSVVKLRTVFYSEVKIAEVVQNCLSSILRSVGSQVGLVSSYPMAWVFFLPLIYF